MTRISRRTFSLLLLLLASFAHAGVLLQFEYPALLILESKDGIYGYYGSTLSSVDEIRPRPVECKFFLYSAGKSSKAAVRYSAKVFFTEKSFVKRKKSYDGTASIFRQDSDWVIQMQRQDAGCDSAAGWNFRLGPNDREVTKFEVTGSVNAIYLRLVVKKANLFFRRGENFSQSRKFLVPGDVVAILDEEKDFSNIRFLNSRTNQTIEGWVRTEALVNPFPN